MEDDGLWNKSEKSREAGRRAGRSGNPGIPWTDGEWQIIDLEHPGEPGGGLMSDGVKSKPPAR